MDKESMICGLAGVGVLAGLGALLSSKDKLTMRVVVARSMTGASLGMAGSLIKVMFPDAPEYVLFGAAAGLAVLGTDGLEAILRGWTRKFRG